MPLMRPTIVGLLLLAAYGNGCRSNSPDTQGQELDLSDGQVGSIQSETEDFEGDDEERSDVKKTGLAHPREFSAWYTRKLLLSERQPSAAAITGCVENIQSRTKNATNLQALADASLSLQGDVAGNRALYHWCFYQMMADLDTKLDRDAPLMNEKADLFLDRMSKLWAAATALDDAIGTDIYMRYLRTRYTEISQNIFGRRLEIMGPESFSLSNGNRGKSAGTYSEE